MIPLILNRVFRALNAYLRGTPDKGSFRLFTIFVITAAFLECRLMFKLIMTIGANENEES
jgi:hypothetical protein